MKTFKTLNQEGIGHVVIALAVAVVAVVGFVGYRVASTSNPSKSSDVATRQTAAPRSIKNSSDIKRANSSLETTNVDSSVNDGQLDSDLNSLL